jgi:predicted RNase H-like HicB family nuclease
MANRFHAIYERDGKWWMGYCPGVSGANGQVKTLNGCRNSSAEAIKLILKYAIEHWF